MKIIKMWYSFAMCNSYLFSSHSGFNMDKRLVQHLDVFLSVRYKKYFLRKIFIIFSKSFWLRKQPQKL